MLTIGKSELRVFCREVEVKKGKKKSTRMIFNACVGSTQNEDETWTNFYVPVNFSKSVRELVDDLELEDGDYFDIVIKGKDKDAWFKAYKDKNDHIQGILFVNKAQVFDAMADDEDEEPKAKSKAPTKTSKKNRT